ncbi:MAG TPA: MFS transporter [Acidimicrobiia bacterium]|nr:MFS transporter [Acidimicrobiia bacterium]
MTTPTGSDVFPDGRGKRAGAAIRRLAVDTTPLRRHRDFRLLWTGELISQTGSQITLVAVFIQVFQLTGSSAAVGIIGVAQLGPLIVMTLLGGPLVDRVDRRRLMIFAAAGQAVASVVLFLGALAGDPPLVLVYVAAGLSGGLAGFSLSTRSATTPNTVPASQLPEALALNQVMWQTCQIVGPALGGVLVGSIGLSWAYGLDVASFGGAIVTAWLMSPQPPRNRGPAGAGRVTTGWRSVVEGFRYLKGRRVLQTTFTADLIAMIFGMPRALFPVLAVTQFHRGEEMVGALFSAVAVGALVGALTTGWVGRIRRQGLAVLVAVGIWGMGITAFGLVGDLLWVAFVCLAVAGAADVISAVFRGTILQQSVPDDLRGRLSSVHIVVVAGGPRLGDFEAGLMAAAFTPTVSVVSGGLICIVGVVALAAAVPEFARYEGPRTSEPGRAATR